MTKSGSLLTRLRQLVHEIVVETVSPKPVINRLRTFIYFFVLIWRGFVVNRCPIRAAALAYTTLLALVPLLAVGVSVSKNFLHESSAELVPRLMDKLFDAVALTKDENARHEAVEKIQGFIDNINAGALGTVGTVFLIFVTLRLLMTIEETFNDIWGIEQGRSIWRRIVYYWTTVTLGPLLLLLAIYCTGRTEFLHVVGTLRVVPGAEKVFLQVMPFAVLWVAFSLMYGLLPNTQVRPVAALAGGVFAGTLWQVNSWLSTLYVSRVVGYNQMYGALGILPVLLVGIYFSWLIVLLGAQVSYAAQNVRAYLQQRASERIDQRGRELLACRAVFVACEHFLRGQPAPSVAELAERIGAPPQWLNQLLSRLKECGVLTRVSDERSGIVPARGPESIRITDVLEAVRTGAGAATKFHHAGCGSVVEKVLGEIDSAGRTTSANHNIRDLVGPESADR